jgi:alpha-tubulin suppressor-like RCC1 family protein
MTTLTLGKIKLVNRGAWSASATYSMGDVVIWNGQSFVYKNETAKQYTALYQGGTGVAIVGSASSGTGVFTGTISSLAANAFSFTVTWDVALQAATDNRITANGNMFAYASYIEPDSKIVSITNSNTTTSVITLNKQSTNISTQASVPVVIGTRRMAGKYEVALNMVDWDALSEGNFFAGAWTYTTSYAPGAIVVRNNNSYMCIHGNEGVDPLFDYIGCWEPFLVGDDALPHQRIITGVNANPWGWRGHPYNRLPTWSNATTINATAMIAGTTYTIVTVGTSTFTNHGAVRNAVGIQFVATSTGTGTGTVACTYSGITWNTPASHKDPITNSLAQCAPQWNTPTVRSYMDYRGSMNHGADGRGQRIASGYSYYGSGVGQVDDSRYFAGENAAQFFNDWYTNDVPVYGNQSYEWNMQRSMSPRLTQNLHKWVVRLALTSYGSVLVNGNSDGGGTIGGEDTSMQMPYVEFGRKSFNNRAIVKLGIPDASRDGSEWAIALDEYGEVWCWGYNGYGQCGIGPENHLNTGYRLRNQTDNVRSPMCLTKEIFFEGNRVVDVFRGQNTAYALDELGQLWGWGRNNYGQLGFQTATGFVSATQCAAPFKIPVNWATYGGIQKILTPECENFAALFVLDGQGHVWAQGYNATGWLGNNTTTATSNATGTITRSSSVNGWSIAGGIKNIWCLSNNGNETLYLLDTSLQMWGCGYAGHNQFGSSSTSNRLIPAQMFGPKGAMTDIVAFAGSGKSGGGSQICIDKDGIGYGTGWNGYGETGVGFITAYPGNNAHPQQQNGSSSTSQGWQRTMMPSDRYAIGNRIIDIWGYGDYEATGGYGHITNHWWLSERGEILQTGKNWNSSTANGLTGNQQYAPVDVPNFS